MDYGYYCYSCKQTCEPERVAMREEISVKMDDDKGYETEGLAPECAKCHYTFFLRDENDESCVICPECQPGMTITVKS
jgi:hypothetical protein